MPIANCQTVTNVAGEVANFKIYFNAFLAEGFSNVALSDNGFAMAYCKLKSFTPEVAAKKLNDSFNALREVGFANLPALVEAAAIDLDLSSAPSNSTR